jgi:hypothetical protein
MKKGFTSLLTHINKVKSLEIKDKLNYLDNNKVIYISTVGWSRDEVDEVREQLISEYHIMNCHSFKSMRLEPLDLNSATRQAFPIPTDTMLNKKI